MKLTIKTLRGGKFEVDVEESHTVEQVKGIIETTQSDLPASALKLIHSGRVLKDADTIASCGIKPTDFLVVMVSKAKKEPTPAPAPAPSPVVEAPTEPATAAASSATTAATTSVAASTPASAANPPASSAAVADDFADETVQNLMTMGFPEPEVRHCLRVAHGNPDLAVQFLTNGIPEGVADASSMIRAAAASSTSTPSTTASAGPTLQSLRNHPQFNDLRRLVQSNPQMLQQVLTQIGQQQPQLLQEINENQELFIQMMNEPIESAVTTPSVNPSSSSLSMSSARTAVGSVGAGGASSAASSPFLAAGLEAMGNPAHMAQMIQALSPDELNQMAAMMGISPDQLRMTAHMLGQMPPEQLQQFMMQAMGGDMPGFLDGGGAGGGGGGGGVGDVGPQVLRLTDEEMAAVDRLADMGFDRAEAAQAFLACDKNETLAANLLMDSMGDGGGGGGGHGFMDSHGGPGGDHDDHDHHHNNNNNNSGDDDDGDDMYD